MTHLTIYNPTNHESCELQMIGTHITFLLKVEAWGLKHVWSQTIKSKFIK